MTVELEQLDNERIVVATILDPINPEEDPKATCSFANGIARQFDGPVYRITDFSNVDLTFSQVTVGLAHDIKISEPNIQHLFIGSGQWIELHAEAGKQEQYGGHDIKLFTSLDEAIAFARQELQSV